MKMIAASVVMSFTAITASAEAQIYHVEQNYNLKQASKAVVVKNWEQASKYLKRATKNSLANEQLQAALIDLCAIDYTLGRLESAKEACDRAIRVNRKAWQAFYNRGHVYRALGQKKAAAADYTKSLALNPNEPKIHTTLQIMLETTVNKYAENKK